MPTSLLMGSSLTSQSLQLDGSTPRLSDLPHDGRSSGTHSAAQPRSAMISAARTVNLWSLEITSTWT
ncbi:hypothetical protein RRG08_059992 [Elysia crispata]|uniref:Uncharacterized protein n=1 Tax=Elysia crispata TaxID=231223 RepID=A0AAE0YDS8_9GAST|nr:hypothetical protein RRG08_059992 [Elysia crispata]